MSTANRLKHRKKLTEQSPDSQYQPRAESTLHDKFMQKENKIIKHTQQKQKQYEQYYEISKCNPLGISSTCTVFPHTADLSSSFGVPMGFTCSPILALDNDFVEVMGKSADKVPRCGVCRAYMNCYNSLQQNKFKCFLCNRQTELDKDYLPQSQQNLQRKSSIFQCLGPQNYYPKEPNEQTFVFLIDINQESASTRMLSYAVAAMKQVLARPELDQICIYFFTYDELLQCYDFSSEEIKCTIHDQTIQGEINNQLQSSFLRDVRDRLFQLLDALEEISANNPRKGSNFSKCFELVFDSLKQSGAKFFILQCNELIAGEQMFREQIMRLPPGQLPQQRNVKGPSLFETCNKSFFQKYLTQSLQNDCSFSYFTFSRNCKNIKTISDVFKLCSSDLKVYNKDSNSELQRFYYEFSYLLGATYFKNLRMECIISAGWHFTAVYGNFYRINNYITFQISNYQSSRKVSILMSPSARPNDPNTYVPPFCCVQLVTNYQYKRESLLCVATIVHPVTGYLNKLYQSVDSTSVITTLAKGFLSSLRMDDINLARKKITEIASQMYIRALQEYKKPECIPDSILTIVMAILAMLKSIHSQPELINNSLMMDKVLSDRLFLQSSGLEVNNMFNPYLFNLTTIDPSMCQIEGDFVYPETVDIKFHNVKDGLYLLDIGLALYLFIAKHCDGGLLQDVFGKSKLSKNDELNEQVLMGQTSPRAQQIQNLIKYLREQKSFGWVPLHVVRCGQNSVNERNFYLFFYGEKYEEFRSYRMNLQQFTVMISKRNSF